jgi:dienelactone hydrolase
MRSSVTPYSPATCSVTASRETVSGSWPASPRCATTPRTSPAGAQAGLTALAGCPETGPRLAAVGFCFGGMAALTLARSGAGLTGVVSIHGSLSTVRPAEPGAVTAKVLVCHGASDPHVPMDDVVAFTEEMNRAGADWQLAVYGRAPHGFTHRHAAPGATPGVAYDPLADERSFAAARTFLADALAGG